MLYCPCILASAADKVVAKVQRVPSVVKPPNGILYEDNIIPMIVMQMAKDSQGSSHHLRKTAGAALRRCITPAKQDRGFRSYTDAAIFVISAGVSLILWENHSSRQE